MYFDRDFENMIFAVDLFQRIHLVPFSMVFQVAVAVAAEAKVVDELVELVVLVSGSSVLVGYCKVQVELNTAPVSLHAGYWVFGADL